MGQDNSAPIELDFTKSVSSGSAAITSLRTFTSYSFDRNILVPASAFRFTAPGVEKARRTAIRSGDNATLWAINSVGKKIQIATGFVDETDTHIVPGQVDYVITGRDTMGQLVDNDCVDAQNRVINTQDITLDGMLALLINSTRIPQGYNQGKTQNIPNGTLLFQTRGGETKISALQRYLDLTNCLLWSAPDGSLILGKPNFSQSLSGSITMSSSNPSQNNALEARSRRNVNQTIRQIVSQLQTMEQVDASIYTKINNDKDVQAVAPALVGRSVYRVFSYGQGADAANTVTAIGNQNGNPQGIGDQLSLREIARENMRVLDVEVVIRGHLNSNDLPYNIDQIYSITIEDDDVNEDMYVYSCSYEMTIEHGMLTHLRLCRLGTICAYTASLAQAFAETQTA